MYISIIIVIIITISTTIIMIKMNYWNPGGGDVPAAAVRVNTGQLSHAEKWQSILAVGVCTVLAFVLVVTYISYMTSIELASLARAKSRARLAHTTAANRCCPRSHGRQFTERPTYDQMDDS